MHTMALLMTITRVKISTMRSTAKHWDINKQQWKAVAKKSRALHFTGWKTSREQMEEMLNNRRHRKLTKKLPKGPTTSPKDGTNFEKVLIEKMEQHNWTLLVACKIEKKNAQSLMQTISNSFHMVGRMMNHVTLQITLTDLRFHFTNVTHQI